MIWPRGREYRLWASFNSVLLASCPNSPPGNTARQDWSDTDQCLSSAGSSSYLVMYSDRHSEPNEQWTTQSSTAFPIKKIWFLLLRHSWSLYSLCLSLSLSPSLFLLLFLLLLSPLSFPLSFFPLPPSLLHYCLSVSLSFTLSLSFSLTFAIRNVASWPVRVTSGSDFMMDLTRESGSCRNVRRPEQEASETMAHKLYKTFTEKDLINDLKCI